MALEKRNVFFTKMKKIFMVLKKKNLNLNLNTHKMTLIIIVKLWYTSFRFNIVFGLFENMQAKCCFRINLLKWICFLQSNLLLYSSNNWKRKISYQYSSVQEIHYDLVLFNILLWFKEADFGFLRKNYDILDFLHKIENHNNFIFSICNDNKAFPQKHKSWTFMFSGSLNYASTFILPF